MVEISAVDKPAQPDAKMTLMKRSFDDEGQHTLSPNEVEQWTAATMADLQRLEKKVGLTDPMDGHTHTVALDLGNGQLLSGETSWQDGHTHPWVIGMNGEIIIGAAQGHTHRVGFLSKGQLVADVLDETHMTVDEPVDAGSDDASDNADDLGNPTIVVNNMATKTDGPEEVQKQLDELKKSNERLQKVAELSDAEKAYMKGLGEDAQTKFLDSSAEDRAAEIAKANEEDPIVGEVNGVQVRKSQDPTGLLAEMVKESKKDKKKLKEMEEKALEKDLEKRAEELNHLPGDLTARKSLLKSIDALPADQRDSALAVLTERNELLAKAFETTGVRGEGDTLDGDAKLDEMAKELQKKDPSLTYEKAYAQVMDTEEGKAVYNKRFEV